MYLDSYVRTRNGYGQPRIVGPLMHPPNLDVDGILPPVREARTVCAPLENPKMRISSQNWPEVEEPGCGAMGVPSRYLPLILSSGYEFLMQRYY